MDKTYQASQFEESLYRAWEEKGLFTARVNPDKKPFSIILPPPNANGSLHWGHALFVYEDIMIRHHKLNGYETLWQLGLDHAGIETQFVFEKELKKQGKSRFDYDRDTLFQMIWDFVEKNKGTIKGQFRRLGYALDWSSEKYTLEPELVHIVYKTFEKLFNDGLVYRANKLVNYCTFCGTSFSDLEVVDKESVGKLYYVDFPVKEGGVITIATTRPETILGDVAVMVNPKDERYATLVGKHVVLPISNREVPIIADDYVEMEFGTGAVKVTPNHDFNDWEIGKKHNLSFPPIIGMDGKIMNAREDLNGLYVKPAREKMIEELTKLNLLKEVKDHPMVLKTCYKCGRTLEPLPLEQWFVKVAPLTKDAVELVNKGEIKVYPQRFEKELNRILENFIDWNISRQNVWGIRIPAYKCKKDGKWFVSIEKPTKCICGDNDFEQDTDTFDTWFSSSQWPFTTLKGRGEDFYDYFYPTSVMETGYDILRAWVSRMIMMGYYATKKVPFKAIYLHGMVRDKHGAKMSKSKGNVMDPLLMVDRYGADAFRGALIFEVKEGADIALSEDRIRGMRNFINKIWNIGRFIEMNKPAESSKVSSANEHIDALKQEFAKINSEYDRYMKALEFSRAFGLMYEFIWHRFADFYIEQLKEELKNGNITVYSAIREVFLESLKLLHPFTPFVTDAIYKQFTGSYILELKK
jgi:valyl-tRNA synthetase